MPNKFSIIGQIFVLAFRDAIRLVRHQWPNLLVVLIAAVLTLLPIGLLALGVQTQLGRIVATALVQTGCLWLTAPYFVALYRFVATGETTRAETIRRSDAVAQFFAWGATLIFISAVPPIVYHLLSPAGPVYYTGSRLPVNQGRLFATLAALLVVGLFQLRVVTLLPASAFGVPSSIRQSLSETRGNFWFVLGALCLPVAAITMTSTLLAKILSGALGPESAALPNALILLATAVLCVLTGISVTVRIYQHLAGPPDREATIPRI
jgi:hypothetical protein